MPSDPGDGEGIRHDPLAHDQRRVGRRAAAGRLTRGRSRVLGGVAYGVAEFVGANPRHVRWLFALASLLSLGIGAIVYALLWLLLPLDEHGSGT